MINTSGLELIERGRFATIFKLPTEEGLRALKNVDLGDWIETLEEVEWHSEFEKAFRLVHPNLIQQYESYEEIHEDGSHSYQIVMELADCSLFDRWEEVDEKKFFRWILEAIRGLQFMHQNGYIHGDVSPFNILIINDHAKLGDFGKCWTEEESCDEEAKNDFKESQKSDFKRFLRIIEEKYPKLGIHERIPLDDLIKFLEFKQSE